MLILSKRRASRFQLKLFSILLPVICISILILVVFLRIYFPDDTLPIPYTEPQPKTATSFSESFLIIILPFLLISGIFLSLELSFFWIPSLSKINERTRGQMNWSWVYFFILERSFYLEFEEVYFVFRRKRSSLSGFFLKELVMEIHLPQDFFFKDVSDFVHKEKVIQTAKDQIIVKTVKFEHLPLDILQIRLLINSVNLLS